MKKIISINEFLKTGSFGGVNLGAKKDEVLELLGEPNDGYADGVLAEGNTGLVYERYEFMFYEGDLKWIQNDHFDPNYPEHMYFENDVIKIEPDIISPKVPKTFAQIELELNELEIACSFQQYFGRDVVTCNSGVILDFRTEKWCDLQDDWVKIERKEDYKLIGFRYHSH